MKDHGEVAAAFHHALESHGVSSEPEAFDVLRGRSKRDAIRRLLLAERGDEPSAVLESRVEAVHASFVVSLTDLLRATGPTPVDGADDTFRWLRERAIKIALTTGFERSITMPLLDRLGWEAHAFDAVVCADDVAVGRPAPFLIFRAMESARAVRVGHVMAVGDTESDRACRGQRSDWVQCGRPERRPPARTPRATAAYCDPRQRRCASEPRD